MNRKITWGMLMRDLRIREGINALVCDSEGSEQEQYIDIISVDWISLNYICLVNSGSSSTHSHSPSSFIHTPSPKKRRDCKGYRTAVHWFTPQHGHSLLIYTPTFLVHISSHKWGCELVRCFEFILIDDIIHYRAGRKLTETLPAKKILV